MSTHSLDPLAQALLDLSLAGMALFRPVYDEQQRITDFTYDYLNPTAQQMLNLPAQPVGTVLQLRPNMVASGVLEFLCQAFDANEISYFGVDYRAEGLDAYYQLAAQRHADQLLVSFTDTADRRHGTLAVTLRESQAREQQALAEAETQRQRLHQALLCIPASIALLRGPEHIYTLVTPEYERLFPGRPTLGRSIREVIPELAGQGFYELFDQVYQTGEPYYAPEMEAWADFAGTGQLQRRYYHTSFQPIRNAQGQVEEVLNFAVDVTANVEARQQVECLNEELRVAQAAIERERMLLQAMFAQAPIAIALFQGSDTRIASANEQMAALWGRTPEQVLGRTLLEAIPELQGQGFDEMIQQVRATGVPYVGTEAPAHILKEGKMVMRYYNFSCHSIYDAQGEALGVINIGTEVTAQVEARQQIERLNAKLEIRVKERTQELTEQQGLLRQILKQVPAFVATLSGPEHRFVFFNDRYARLSANRAKLHATVAEVLPEVVEQGFIKLLDQVYSSGQLYIGREIAILIEQEDGPAAQHYLDFTYQPLTDGQGQVQGILAFGIDVTEQVRARRQATTLQEAVLGATKRKVKEREELYQVFAQAPAAIVLLREPNHRIEYANPAYQKLFPEIALVGRLLVDVHPSIVQDGTLAHLDRVYETGEPYIGEEQPFSVVSNPGEPPQIRYFNFTHYPYREAGRIVGIALFAYDTTEQALARKQQAQQKRRLQSVFEQAPVAIFVLRGPAYVTEVVNTAMSEMLGRPAAAILDKPYFEAIPELATQGYPELLAQVWQTGEPVIVEESPAQLAHHQPGETGYFTFVYQPLFDTDSKLTDIMCVAVDVTAQVLARQQVQQLNQDLAAKNKELYGSNTQLMRTNAELDTFVYTASHDLKAPIANIEGLLIALRQDLPAEIVTTKSITNLLTLMEKSITRFQHTIRHLTNITQLQQDSVEATQQVELAGLLEGICLDLAPAIEAAQAQLTLDIEGCTSVRFTPKNLRSIFFNLLSNALKYRDPTRALHVQVRTSCTDKQISLVVQDNGLGLSPEEQTKLFTLFKRLHAHIEGSGVGLFSIKKIVDNAGGTITVQSALGEGTTFTVVLPS